tara:strand:+ start:49682 stop:50977 length:1296 start_codon:yes stop_codon:yes gene_type:complete
MVKKAASAAKDFLTKDRSVWQGAKAVARPVAKLGARALGLAPAAAAYAGYKGGDALKDTKAAKSLQRPLTNAIAKATGTDDLQNRMLSDDSAVSKAAIAEFRTSQGQEAPLARPGQEQVQADAAVTAEAEPGIQRPGVEVEPLGIQQQAGPAINATRTQPVPGVDDLSYAGDYGDTSVFRRPTVGNDGKVVIDPMTGQPVPEFGDQASLTGNIREDASGRSARDQAEAERVAIARQQYEQNTTMSDGRRAFGGPTMEKLREGQGAAVARGDTAVVTRQLAEEGLTPEQRAAYASDPAGAYATDAGAKQAAAAAVAKSAEDRYQMLRDFKTDQRAEQTESRRADSATEKSIDAAMKPFADPMVGLGAPVLTALRGRLAKTAAPGQDVNMLLAEMLAESGSVTPDGALDPAALSKWLMDTETGSRTGAAVPAI